jgi:hypothetical protein
MTSLVRCPRPRHCAQAHRFSRRRAGVRPASLTSQSSSANPNSAIARMLDIPVWGGFCAIHCSVLKDVPRSAVPIDLAPSKANSCGFRAAFGTSATMTRTRDVLQHSRSPLATVTRRNQIGRTDWLPDVDRSKRNDQRLPHRLWNPSIATFPGWLETRDSCHPTGRDIDSVSRVARHSG